MRRLGLLAARWTALLTGAAALLAGCDATRRDWSSCWVETCADGGVCDQDHHCVPLLPRLDAGSLDGVHLDGAPGLDAGGLEGAPSPDASDAPVPPLDAALDGALDLAAVDAGAVDLAVDSSVPDAPGSCSADDDCSAGLPFCVDRHCVACKTAQQCGASSPVCSAEHACVSCAAVDAGCPSQAPACEGDSGRCVECLADGDCPAEGAPFCVANACVGCAAAAAEACAKRDPGKPACLTTGRCVECTRNSDCSSPGKPICDTTSNLCRSCTSDSECQGLPGPGVCMAEQDGHCATDAETLYVGALGGRPCSDSAQAAGSAATPFCTLQLAVSTAKARVLPLLVVSGALTGGFTGVSLATPLLVVGKQAVITPAPGADGISIVSGDLTLRGITVHGSADTSTGIGVQAAATSGNSVVLRMDTCAVTDNPGGGILLNGAGFVIRNTTVSRNGPNPNVWGGISIQNPPAAGPTTLAQVTISDNQQVGLSCSTALAASNAGSGATSGVLASGNSGGVDISAMCGIAACTAASAGCGAQSLP